MQLMEFQKFLKNDFFKKKLMWLWAMVVLLNWAWAGVIHSCFCKKKLATRSKARSQASGLRQFKVCVRKLLPGLRSNCGLICCSRLFPGALCSCASGSHGTEGRFGCGVMTQNTGLPGWQWDFPLPTWSHSQFLSSATKGHFHLRLRPCPFLEVRKQLALVHTLKPRVSWCP